MNSGKPAFLRDHHDEKISVLSVAKITFKNLDMRFVMNSEPFTKAEVKERVVSVRFRQSDNDSETLEAMKGLKAIPRAKLATIGDQLLKDRQKWEA